jgi:hypothetical protein
LATIEVRGLRKTYGATVAVDEMDLDVAEGEILGILDLMDRQDDHRRVRAYSDPNQPWRSERKAAA